MKKAPPKPGRPPGAQFTRTKSVKIRDIDAERLRRLSERMDRDQSWIIRHGIEVLAIREGLE